MFQMGFVPGLFRQAAGAAYSPTGTVIPSDLPGAFAMGLRRPVGRGRGDRAVERRADPLGPVDRGAAGVRQHGGAEAVGGVALRRRSHLGRDLRRGRAARRRAEHVTHDRAGAEEIGDELVANPLVRRINFTGSTATGRKLAEAAGRNLKRVVLELGGQNPLIVLADADLEYAVNAAAFGAYLHQGQICMSARKIIVERGVADEFSQKLAAKVRRLGHRRPARAHHHHRPAHQSRPRSRR